MDYISPLPPRARTPHARVGILMTALIVLVAGYGATRTSAFQWFLLRASLRSQFQQVRWITTRELAGWLNDRQRQPPILLDVRTADEWNVSHLPDALRVDPGAPVETALPNIPKETPIVAYCAVGYRSAELTNRMRSAGFTHVQNLDGSIFQWANEHRPLVNNAGPTSLVHPYNQFWGRLLSEDLRGSL